MLLLVWVVDTAITATLTYVLGRIILPEVGLQAPGLWPLLVVCGLWYAVQLSRVWIAAALTVRS